MSQLSLIASRYALGDLIGQGGMGAVYAGRDTQTGQTVAIKLLRPDLVAAAPDAVARFAREGAALRALAHPNIVAVLATDSDGERHAIVMEYAPGGSLADLLRTQPQLPIPVVLQLALDLSDALARVHRLDIVHRDLKPANVLLAADGTPRLSDFGVASFGDQLHLTQTGALIGTAPYLCPEGWRGEALDGRADIWAFGALLYELLAGRRPFEAEHPAALMHAILSDAPPHLRVLRPDAPGALVELIGHMLVKQRERRLESVRQVGLTAEALLRGSVPPTIVLARDEAPTESLAPTAAQLPSDNLPAPPNALIGRTKEVAAASELLRQPNLRLLTLSGPGGTGKTRLALQVAAELRDAFPHGVWFVNLAPISDPNLVAATIAQVLGVKEVGEQPLIEILKRFLHEKRLLLLLDNFEQVVDAAPLVGELLAAAPRLKVLVTSRIVLRVYGEQEFPVPPLALPDPRHLTPASPDSIVALAQYEAVALFVARARSARPDFALTSENAATVAEICARLDGLPLAIELAAVRIKLFASQALLARLDNRLKLLTGGARDLPARQQTLRGAIDWSYDLLDENEKKLFVRLGVFVGGCTLEAAEAVCNADGDLPVDVIDRLAALVDKSLLLRAEGAGGEPRFTMLETIREYALMQLVASGVQVYLEQAHASYFLQQAEDVQDEAVWLKYMGTDHDNLRAALHWALMHDPGTSGLRLCAALWSFWDTRGHWSEGRRWIEAMVAAAPHATPQLRMEVCHCCGELAWKQGDYPAAMAMMTESLSLSRLLGRKDKTAHTLMILGKIALDQGNYEHSAFLLHESLELSRLLGEPAPGTLMVLGEIMLAQADYSQAQRLFEESLAICRERGETFFTARLLCLLGETILGQGDAVRARVVLRESVICSRDIQHRRVIAFALAAFASAAATGSEPPAVEVRRAVRIWGAVEALREEIGMALPVGERTRYERFMSHTRARLSSEEWATLWAAGRALTLEQAITEALDR